MKAFSRDVLTVSLKFKNRKSWTIPKLLFHQCFVESFPSQDSREASSPSHGRLGISGYRRRRWFGCDLVAPINVSVADGISEPRLSRIPVGEWVSWLEVQCLRSRHRNGQQVGRGHPLHHLYVADCLTLGAPSWIASPLPCILPEDTLDRLSEKGLQS